MKHFNNKTKHIKVAGIHIIVKHSKDDWVPLMEI